MRTLITCLGIGMLLSACGSSSSGGGTSTSTSVGTGTQAAAGTGTGTETSTVPITPQGSCAAMTCYGALVTAMNGCTPSGSCTMAGSLPSIALCYANGVKMSVSMNTASGGMSVTAKNDAGVCWSADVSGTTYTVKDAAGKPVGTMATDASGKATITCADGTTGILDETCANGSTGLPPMPSAAAVSGCTPGACAF